MDERDADGRRHRLAFGAAVRELRARRGLSQEEAGFRGRLHRNYVGAIERGEINPTFRVILKLCDGLDIPMAELVAVYERQLAAREQRCWPDDVEEDRTSDTQLRLVRRLLGRVGPECRRVRPSHPAKSPVALGNEEGGHRCSAPVTPFLDQPKYGSGQVQESGLAGCEGHSKLVEGRARKRWRAAQSRRRSAKRWAGSGGGAVVEVRGGAARLSLGEGRAERRRRGGGRRWRGSRGWARRGDRVRTIRTIS